MINKTFIGNIVGACATIGALKGRGELYHVLSKTYNEIVKMYDFIHTLLVSRY